MMEEGRYDRIQKLMLSRVERVSDKIVKDFKKSKPFDKEMMTARERLFEYSQRPPDWKQQLLNQGVSMIEIEKYDTEMQGLIRRYGNG